MSANERGARISDVNAFTETMEQRSSLVTIKYKDAINRALAILLGNAKAEEWSDVVALRFAATEANRKANELAKIISEPKPHSGPHSGEKGRQPKPETVARNAAAKAINDGISSLILMGKSLRGMRVYELQRIATSASETATIAHALLAKIGANPDPTALVSDTLTEKDIKKVFSDTLGKSVKEYRDMASQQM
jgi:hypothetical protein